MSVGLTRIEILPRIMSVGLTRIEILPRKKKSYLRGTQSNSTLDLNLV
jgi:hypothetical protein